MAESWMASETYSPDNLIASDFPIATRAITLLSGENRARGALLGKITKALGSATYGGGNTGNGTIGSITMGLLTKLGTYLLTCLTAPTTSYTAPTTGTAGGGNTGNGTMTAVSVGSSSLLKAGTYTMTCVAAASNAGTFKVVDPDGNRLDDATVGVAYNTNIIDFTINDGSSDFIVGDTFTVAVTAVGNSGTFSVRDPEGNLLPDATVAVAYTNAQLNFTIADGSTDFAVGDTISVPVSAGSGKYKLSTTTAVDGSQELKNCVILAQDTNATSADVDTISYTAGEFNQNELTLGSAHTAASIKEELRLYGIHLVDSLEAA